MGMLEWMKGGGESSVMSSRQGSVMGPDDDQSLLSEGLGSLPAEASAHALFHPEHEEARYIQRRIRDNPMWTLDRGTGFYVQERISKKKASLLGSGKDAGKSMINYQGIEWSRIMRHIWKRDFFTTAVHARFQFIVLAMICTFISTFLLWACVYYAIWRWEPRCFLGFSSFLSAFLFSIETQNTIGYGSHAIGDCWLPAWLVGIQCILAVLLEAIFLGIIFAKISHPKGRSRTIIISECSCIARRDGILKFMFRVADMRKRTAIAPKIIAHLYTWGPGHTTAEGEHVPVQVQDLPLHFLDSTLLLPVVVEHTIDERSPLYGHTSQSLEALGAEVVVTFEGHSELGDAFMTRISYLPNEIHWGCTFVNIIQHASSGSMKHSVDLSRFHEVEPQEGLALMPPSRVSHAVVRGGSRRIPRPRLGENTLQLADELVVTQAPDGSWFVAVRVGDAYPSQMCNARVQMFIYRYNVPGSPLAAAAAAAAAGSSGSSSRQAAAAANAAAGAVPCASHSAGPAPITTYVHQELALTRHLWRVDPAVEAGLMADFHPHPQQQQQQGSDPSAAVRVSAAVRAAAAASAASHAGGGVNVLLRYPVVVGHEITPDSPLKDWITHDGMLKDADAEIVVVTSATQYCSSRLAMRSKVYSVLGSVRWGCSYGPCVVPPAMSPTGHALVDWGCFHDVVPFHSEARSKGMSSSSRPRQPGGGGSRDGSTPQDSSVSGQQGQQQLRHSKGAAGAAAAWFDSSVDVGASWGTAVNSSQQLQQQQPQRQGSLLASAGQDAFEVQVEDMLARSFTEQQQLQQQQQQGATAPGVLAAEDQQPGANSGSSSGHASTSRRAGSAPAPLSGVVVHDGLSRAHTDTSIPVAVAVRQKNRQQQRQHLGSGSGLGVAHSLGFDHFHDVAQMQARLQQQRQQKQQQQQQQQRQLGSSSTFPGPGVRQGISSAAQLHEAVGVGAGGEFACSSGSAAAADAAAAMAAGEAVGWGRRRSSAGASSTVSEADSAAAGEGLTAPGLLGGGERGGFGPSSAAAVRHAVGGGGWGHEAEEGHTFKGSYMSEGEGGANRSLAAVMDLFKIAEQVDAGAAEGQSGDGAGQRHKQP